MLEVELEQIVWLCHHTLPPRQAEVVEMTDESCRVMFLEQFRRDSFWSFLVVYWIQ